MAIVAALYPLWGALLGGTDTVLWLRPFFFMPFLFAAGWLLIVWLLAGVAEARFLAVPAWRHVLGAVALSPVWFYVLVNVISDRRLLLVAVAAHSVARASVVAMAWVSRPAKEGVALCTNLNSLSAGLAIGCGGIAALLCGIRPAVLMLLVGSLVIRLLREWYYRRLGGINATALSITQRITELSTLLIAVFVQ